MPSILLFKTAVKPSSVAGEGLFAEEFIPQGAVISPPNDNIVFLSEDEYNRRSAAGDRLVVRNGERLYGDMFYYLDQDEEDPCNFINHHPDANALLFMSFLFALRDIQAGEEITCDYTLNTNKHDIQNVLGVPAHLVGAQDDSKKLAKESIARLVKALQK